MTKAKKFMYRIQYTNDTYQIVDWTKDEFKKAGEHLCDTTSPAFMMENEIFIKEHIKAIVYLPPAAPPSEEEILDVINRVERAIDEWGMGNPEDVDYLNSLGYRVTPNGVKRKGE